MHGAFVVQLGPETKPAEGRFEGWVEEVDSCTELRFRSSEELLKFVGQRFDLARASVDKTRLVTKASRSLLGRKPPARKEVRHDIIRILLLRAFVLVILISSFVT